VGAQLHYYFYVQHTFHPSSSSSRVGWRIMRFRFTRRQGPAAGVHLIRAIITVGVGQLRKVVKKVAVLLPVPEQAKKGKGTSSSLATSQQTLTSSFQPTW
jgi:hypothetical protein